VNEKMAKLVRKVASAGTKNDDPAGALVAARLLRDMVTGLPHRQRGRLRRRMKSALVHEGGRLHLTGAAGAAIRVQVEAAMATALERKKRAEQRREKAA